MFNNVDWFGVFVAVVIGQVVGIIYRSLTKRQDKQKDVS